MGAIEAMEAIEAIVKGRDILLPVLSTDTYVLLGRVHLHGMP